MNKLEAVEIIATAPLTLYLASFGEARRRGLTALVLVTVLATVAMIILGASHDSVAQSAVASCHRSVAWRLDRTVEVCGGLELAGLAAAFNTMTDNLRRTLAELARREAVAAVGEFAASLAHEVRNPLRPGYKSISSASKNGFPPPPVAGSTRACVAFDRTARRVSLGSLANRQKRPAHHAIG